MKLSQKVYVSLCHKQKKIQVQNLNTRLRLKPASRHQQLGCRNMVKEAPSKYCFLFRRKDSLKLF